MRIFPTRKIRAKRFLRRKSYTIFGQRVLKVVSQIPRGKTLSYKEVAKKAGNEKASRAVGAIMKTNYNPKIPCHRVIRSDGKTGNYNRGALQKIALLKKEGAIK